MKQKIVLLGVAVMAFLFIFQSCKKDNLSDLETNDGFQKREMGTYDQFGPKLEQVVDRAIKEDAFKNALIKLTQERPMGDFEVLMTSLLNFKTKEDDSIRAVLLKHASGLFSKEELDAFLDNYPSLIIATRGNLVSWAKGEYTPPVVFVPSDFDEKTIEITGTKDESNVTVKLDKAFEDAVVVMHLSERHDQDGNPIVMDHTPKPNVNTKPNVNLSKRAGTGLSSSVVEPTSCVDPLITSFTAESVGGGIKLSYEIDDFSEDLGSWGQVTFVREGVDGNGLPETISFVRFADQPRTFFDTNFLPNVTYTYTISVRTHYIDATLGGWVVCYGNSMTETVVAPDALPLLSGFRGRNFNNSTLMYNWSPVQGIPIDQYRLRVMGNSGYTQVATLSPTTNQYLYNHPAIDRGTLVDMQIQYKALGSAWQGDFLDRSYASYRNPNEPLQYFGLRIPNIGSVELGGGDNMLFGAPEIRLVAFRGAGTIDDNHTTMLQHTIIFMQACVKIIQIGPFQISVPTGYYIPISGQPVDILSQWNNDVPGSAVSIKISETDVAEIIVNGPSYTVSLDGVLGFKEKVTNGAAEIIGLETKWTSAQSLQIDYPVSDIFLDNYTIYYHQPRVLSHNNNLYGHMVGQETIDCLTIEEYLD